MGKYYLLSFELISWFELPQKLGSFSLALELNFLPPKIVESDVITSLNFIFILSVSSALSPLSDSNFS